MSASCRWCGHRSYSADGHECDGVRLSREHAELRHGFLGLLHLADQLVTELRIKCKENLHVEQGNQIEELRAHFAATIDTAPSGRIAATASDHQWPEGAR